MRERMVGGVGFDEDVLSILEPSYECMYKRMGWNLKDWWEVRQKAERIKNAIVSGRMPPGGASLEQSKINKFIEWIDEGMPKKRAEILVKFFSDVDKQTIHENPIGSGVMNQARIVIQQVLPEWEVYARAIESTEAESLLKKLNEKLQSTDLSKAVKDVGAMLCKVVEENFVDQGNGNFDSMALLDAFEHFGRDRFSRDDIRASQYPSECEAQFHRMHDPITWFNWAGQIECAVLLFGESDPRHHIRTAMMNSLILGCSMDFVFRKMPKSDMECSVKSDLPRGKILSDYHPDKATETLIRERVFKMLNRWSRAASFIRKLYRVFEGIEN